ncbi:aminodeoxychorismate lyase [Photobacterium lipolyticum]|uniref:Aminodeoxychorismate lyase n=1 Tax=Photobacterium lipolyticum TaxID=266810 RepID=A0A2T3MSM6_9GAMM|nr:aminodeoxychorismate lyase [Photobacterium lipolyticum]PSW01143.1 aminodeoxychorismate lyase [Photobacterium lipolyticum]
MVLINGCEQTTVPVADRAMQYGDGCFTTILVELGKPRLWPLHLQRLQKNVSALYITEPDWGALARLVHQRAASYSDKGVVKVLISRGVGGRGYSAIGCDDTQVVVSDFSWPQHYAQWQQQGIELGVSEQRLGLVPMLAGLKHLNRLEQVLLKRELECNGWQDAVVLDVNGHVMETTASNVFWRNGKIIYTPELDVSGVHGVMRAHVIELIAGTEYCLEFVKKTLEGLLCAEEIFITNALMALVPVTRIDGRDFPERTAISVLNKRLYSC